MSEVIHTGCDGCPTIINVDPEVAINEYGWMEDEYGCHFCTACQETAADLEAEEASGEELEVFSTQVDKAAKSALKLKKRARRE